MVCVDEGWIVGARVGLGSRLWIVGARVGFGRGVDCVGEVGLGARLWFVGRGLVWRKAGLWGRNDGNAAL